MRKTTELEDKGYKRKFVWWPVKLVCKGRNVWIWWEYMLVKGLPWHGGDWRYFYLNLDGSEVK